MAVAETSISYKSASAIIKIELQTQNLESQAFAIWGHSWDHLTHLPRSEKARINYVWLQLLNLSYHISLPSTIIRIELWTQNLESPAFAFPGHYLSHFEHLPHCETLRLHYYWWLYWNLSCVHACLSWPPLQESDCIRKNWNRKHSLSEDVFSVI